MTKTLVGIDLGTTYSLVSVLQDGQPVLLPNALGELLTPSAVSLDGDDNNPGTYDMPLRTFDAALRRAAALGRRRGRGRGEGQVVRGGPARL